MNQTKTIDHRIFNLEHHDPHSFLGLHNVDKDKKVIRLWRPEASEVHIELFGKIVDVPQIHDSGIFEVEVKKDTSYKDYRVYHHSGALSYDPYAFLPFFGEMDTYLFSQGVHYKIYDIMGAHVTTHQGCKGVKFAVWAPNALSAALVGDFNHWDGRYNPMRSMGNCGVWELFIPGLAEGSHYKYEIRTQHKHIKVKADPYAFHSEKRPQTASIAFDVDRFIWFDKEWMQKRFDKRNAPQPMNIYEVHLGSWNRKNGEFMNYREIAHRLTEY